VQQKKLFFETPLYDNVNFKNYAKSIIKILYINLYKRNVKYSLQAYCLL
jgi:hypothetical protein